jgi:hypothetical protein
MGLFKKNPVFCIFCAIFLLVFAGGCYLVFAESGKLTKSKKQVANAESQIKGLLYAAPAPTVENVAVSEKNAEQLRAELQRIREDLQRGSRLTTSSDGVRVMAGIQQYISEYQKLATAHIGPNEVPTPIDIPDNFAFGFDQYIDEAIIPEDQAVVPVLDKQRQILSYIVNQLIATHPAGIQKVEREVLEVKVADSKAPAGFQINPAISARVPGAIDTLAFSVTFTGYTTVPASVSSTTWRSSILPIVVRSVEVERPVRSCDDLRKAKKSTKGKIDDIFSVFGAPASDSKTTEGPKANQTPVISENISSFTVTLEFIEIILPSDSEENPS